MAHDLIAELTGYRNELANTGDADLAKQVQAQVDRVSGEIKAEADALDSTAKEHDDNGQDVPAAEARVESRRLRNALDTTPTDTRPAEAEEKAVPAAKETASRARRTTKG
jgi:hypothetical protein